jgi:hypothetical protein
MEQKLLHEILARLTKQGADLEALRQENAALAQKIDGLATLCMALPEELRPPLSQGTFGEYLDAVNRDIQGAFYPPQPAFLHGAQFLRYWQLLNIDLAGKRLGVLTTTCAEYPDVLETTRAAECMEIRLHSIRGPFTSITVDQSGKHVTKDYCGGLESALLPLEERDLLWIPDPSLARLVLLCQGLLRRIGERMESFLLPIRVEDSQENVVRISLHRHGFTEIRRIPESEATAYVTRWHETRGLYALTPPQPMETPVRILFSTKTPSASFRLVSRTMEKEE